MTCWNKNISESPKCSVYKDPDIDDNVMNKI